MRLSRVPVLSLGCRVLVYDPGGLRTARLERRADTAFQRIETVRGLLGRGSGIPSFAYPLGTTTDAIFEAPYRPRQLASLGSRRSFPPAGEFCYWAGG